MTSILIIAIVFLLALLPVILSRLGGLRSTESNSSYVAVKSLLTPAERSFFGVLSQAAGTEFQIFVKVRLADLIQPAETTNRKLRWAAFNRISSKHVDFVICSPQDLSVKAILELDDSSHTRSDRKERDGFLDSALSSAQIPVLHVTASHSYSPHQLRTDIQTAINRKTTI